MKMKNELEPENLIIHITNETAFQKAGKVGCEIIDSESVTDLDMGATGVFVEKLWVSLYGKEHPL